MANEKEKTGKQKGKPTRRERTNRCPLRKIVGYIRDEESGCDRELLECGHSQRPRRDMIGETNASRRPCRGCRREAELTKAVPFP